MPNYAKRSNESPIDPSRKHKAMQPRKGEGEMPEEDFRLIVESVLSDAEDYVDGDLGPDREKATDYYKGRPFGNEEAGRSQIVLTEVRDAVDNSFLPSLLRVFTGPEHAVEFAPKTKDGIKLARLMTDAVRAKFEGSGGWLKLYWALKDGLVRKLGVFSWDWVEEDAIEESEFSGLTEEQLNVLAEEDGVEIIEKEAQGETTPESHPMSAAPNEPWMDNAEMGGEPAGEPIQLFKGRLSRTLKKGDVEYNAIPPSELIFSRTARTPYDTLYIGRRRRVTKGELLAMGYEEEDFEEHMSLGKLVLNEETDARNPSENEGDPEAGDENQEAVYHEGYLRCDYDGRGIGIFKLCAVGSNYHVLHIERADEIKIAVWTPYPEPHTLVGDSLADKTMDLQLLKSALARGILDSLSASIFPRMAYVESFVNPEDVLNTEIGGPLRVRNTNSVANAIQAFEVPFAGGPGLELLQYTDQIRESRTGRSGGPAGLDQDALQSTEKAAAKAAVTASQMTVEMVARVAAEMLIKPLFRGIMREMVRHQPDPYMAKIRDEWVEVDPRVWKIDFDVQVNVALGAGFTEGKLAGLDKIISRQVGMLTQAPDNPLASWVELRNALAAEAELLGYRDVSRFYKKFTEEDLMQMRQAQATQPPAPTPEQVLAEGEIEAKRMEVEGKLAIERDRLELQREEMLLVDDRERDKNEMTIMIQRMKIEAETGVKLAQAELDAVAERDRGAREDEDRAADAAQRAADAELAQMDASVRVFEATNGATESPTTETA